MNVAHSKKSFIVVVHCIANDAFFYKGYRKYFAKQMMHSFTKGTESTLQTQVRVTQSIIRN